MSVLRPDSLKRRCAVLAAAFWWGCLGSIGGLVVPVLFRHLPTAALAGNTAAQLFSALTWVALACGSALVLLLTWGAHDAWAGARRRHVLALVLIGLLAALCIEWVAAPHILAREQLRFWHTLASGLFLLQWLSTGAALWWLVPGGGVKTPS